MDRPRFVRMACVLVVVTFPSAAGAQSADLVPDRATLERGTSGGQVAHGGDRVVFQSPVGDLVPGDTNRENDLFLHRRSSGRTVRVSVGPGGRQVDRGSFNADLSGDGRWLTFCSSARTLLGRRVAVPDPPASRGGRFVAFACDSFVHVHHHVRGTVRVVAPSCERPLISADGVRIAFQSVDPLLPGGSPDETEVYTLRRAGGPLQRVASAPDGGHPGGHVLLSDLSGNGRWVAFSSTSTLLGFPRVSPWGDVFTSGPWR